MPPGSVSTALARQGKVSEIWRGRKFVEEARIFDLKYTKERKNRNANFYWDREEGGTLTIEMTTNSEKEKKTSQPKKVGGDKSLTDRSSAAMGNAIGLAGLPHVKKKLKRGKQSYERKR